MNILKNGTESAIRSAYEGQGFNVPEGFKVTTSGRDLIIQAEDEFGVPIKVTATNIGSGGDKGVSILESAVQEFLSKFN